jgi:hypothetical protein
MHCIYPEIPVLAVARSKLAWWEMHTVK